jgi:tetratricopeptide (TPR) repeat protein
VPVIRQKLTYYDAEVQVGRRLRETRLEAGLSQRELAFPGCTAAYISRIERGERVPSLQILREFALRLGVSESYLARGADDPAELSPFLAAKAAIGVGEVEEARRLVQEAVEQATGARELATASALQGEVALHEGNAAVAIAALERALELDPSIEQDDPSVADSLGRAHERANDYDSAIAVFVRNYDGAGDVGDQLSRARFGALLANAYSDTGDFARAEALLGELIATSTELADPLMRARVYWSQSRMHARKHEGDSAAHYAELALEVLELSDQSYYAALAHLLLAHIELDRDNPRRALELLDEAEPLVTASGRPYERANLQLERARGLATLGHGAEAVSLALAAGPLLEQTSALEAGRGYASMAAVIALTGDSDRAIERYEHAIELLETVPSRYLVDVYSELATLYEDTGKPDRALEILHRAVKVRTRPGAGEDL